VSNELKTNLENWVSSLQDVRLPGVFNPWSDWNPDDLPDDGPSARADRLLRHLLHPSPRYLLVGEAIGHLGAKVSGIAFTSERLLYEGAVPRLHRQLQRRITERDRPYSEPSATIVWRTAYRLGIADDLILWNAFPWHPHGPSPNSNRPPLSDELALGFNYVESLVSFYDDLTVIAVGKHASRSLEVAGIPAQSVRHPSMGGSIEFADQLSSITSR